MYIYVCVCVCVCVCVYGSVPGDKPADNAAERTVDPILARCAGSQFTCFTSTKVQILTQRRSGSHTHAMRRLFATRWPVEWEVLSLLALQVQKCKY